MQRSFIRGNTDLLLLICDDEKIKRITAELPCSVLVLSGFDWNKDLSPWPAEAVFKGPDFTGKADETIEQILADPIWQKKWNKVYAGGYSMAGLFLLYMSTKTDCFNGIASCSGSLWFDNFIEYLHEHPVKTKKVYLSVGDREGHSRNKRMKQVIQKTQEAADMISNYAETCFEMNTGTHFDDPEGRLRKGILWLLNK